MPTSPPASRASTRRWAGSPAPISRWLESLPGPPPGYREALERAGDVRALVASVVERLGTAFRLQPGHCVDEVVPVQADKATAVTRFIGCAPYRGKVPVFVGDDLTDEHGFAVVERLGGWTVKVGPGRTAARFRLPDAAAVKRWLLAPIGAEASCSLDTTGMS